MHQLILKNHNLFSNIKPEYNKMGKIEIFENELRKMLKSPDFFKGYHKNLSKNAYIYTYMCVCDKEVLFSI